MVIFVIFSFHIIYKFRILFFLISLFYLNQKNFRKNLKQTMFKSKNSTPTSSFKHIQQSQQTFVIQKIARIDGQQTQKIYKKCQLLGKGGFANCFVTQNLQTKKRAATKIIQKDLLSSQKTKLRLLNEIRLHKTLHHQNIVQFQHYFQDKDNVYIFLQLCQNQSLNQVIKVRQFFSTPQIQSFIYGIVQGLKYLHKKCIIHRDLKLGNVFLDKKFQIKIGDFGLATKLEFKRQCKRTICGTPNYIAPEILQGKGYHFQVDIWSVGVILYTLYFNTPPFQTQEANTTYQKIKKCEYTIPKALLVPNQAIDLIKKILVKNPADRPTLDQILMSDFMKLGGKIYKQLPSICSKRTPNKKDFNNLPYYTFEQIKLKLQKEKSNELNIKPQKIVESLKQQLKYIVNFENLGEGKYFYTLNNDFPSVFTSNQIVFKDEYGLIKFFNPNDKPPKLKNCQQNPLKYLLNCKIKQKNLSKQSTSKSKDKQILFQATLYPTQIPLHIKKISQHTKHNFYMIRLSNQTIQLVFQDGIDYLITSKGQQIYEIKNGKISQEFILQKRYVLGQGEIKKISTNKINYIKAVLEQIKVMKEKVQCKKVLKQNQGQKQMLKKGKQEIKQMKQKQTGILKAIQN